MGMTAPFLTAEISAAGGAGAGAGALGALGAAAPWLAIPAAAAAYGFSPTVRHYVNDGAKQLWGAISNPMGPTPGGLGAMINPLGHLFNPQKDQKQQQQHQIMNALSQRPITGAGPAWSPLPQPAPPQPPIPMPQDTSQDMTPFAGLRGLRGPYGGF